MVGEVIELNADNVPESSVTGYWVTIAVVTDWADEIEMELRIANVLVLATVFAGPPLIW